MNWRAFLQGMGSVPQIAPPVDPPRAIRMARGTCRSCGTATSYLEGLRDYQIDVDNCAWCRTGICIQRAMEQIRRAGIEDRPKDGNG